MGGGLGIRYNPDDHPPTVDEHLQSLGKPKKLALTIIMRKLLQAFWVMQHRDQPFIARKSFSVPAK